MKIVLVTLVHNRKHLVGAALQSAVNQTLDKSKWIHLVIDNASTDGSVEMVRNQFPTVRIIKNDENKGFIVANNQGIEISEGRYVLLLNSDTVILKNAIAKTMKFADEHPDAAVVGCRVLNPDRTLQRTCAMYHSVLNMLLSATYLYKIFPKSKFFGREEMTWWEFNDVREV